MTASRSPRRPRDRALGARIAALATLDRPAAAIAKQIRGLLGPGALKDAISGT
jgi:hypothetical protein